MFNLETCAASALAGNLQDWVLEYLSTGYWANLGLRDGLLLHKRYWIRPLSIELSRLQRCCGPEPEMTYRVPRDIWNKRIENTAADLDDPESLPPLIVEWHERRLIVRDDSRRHAAMTSKGWKSCFAVVWCNSEEDRTSALSQKS
ncbi:hypothetical protein [Oryzifoliimicrobium ureilyticus]|uniref:hypothetical protein n=1 Tax=Oryzifoliimicrobium ureilyticus TaxID=3113724 RepID=UPI0030763710